MGWIKRASVSVAIRLRAGAPGCGGAARPVAAIAATLAEHGADMQDVVRATVWLADLQEFPAFNEVYVQYFADALPARSTVQATLAYGAALEIEVQAYVGDGATG